MAVKSADKHPCVIILLAKAFMCTVTKNNPKTDALLISWCTKCLKCHGAHRVRASNSTSLHRSCNNNGFPPNNAGRRAKMLTSGTVCHQSSHTRISREPCYEPKTTAQHPSLRIKLGLKQMDDKGWSRSAANTSSLYHIDFHSHVVVLR